MREFIQDVGIPDHLHTDGAKEMTMGTWKQVCQDAGIRMSQTEKSSPWQNRTEVEIRELKRHVCRLMNRTATPHKLWDFCCLYVTDLRSRLARPLPQLNGRTPYELITGNTPDVSEFLEFEWYQPIWYYEPSAFPQQNRLIARWIGIAHHVGQAMCYWILPQSGIPIARTTIQPISQTELNTTEIQSLLSAYDTIILERMNTDEEPEIEFQLYREDEEPTDNEEDELAEPNAQALKVDNIEADTYDEILHTQPILMKDGTMTRAKIIGRKRDGGGNPVGNFHPNPLLNTRVYLAKFNDGQIMEYSANTIAEAIYNQVTDDGTEEVIFKEIIDHKRDKTAISVEEAQQIMSMHNQTSPIFTTKGWQICISWQNDTTS